MSPTQFVVQMAAAEKRCKRARIAGDLREMQAALAQMTALRRAYYGSP
jgi:hypothetical protein